MEKNKNMDNNWLTIEEKNGNVLLKRCAREAEGEIVIPDGVTTIDRLAFSGCRGLTSVNIPASVTTIGEGAFSDCSGLTSVNIPSSVTTIAEGTFSYCSGLLSIKVEEGNPVYDSRDKCNAIIESSTNTLISGCKNTIILDSVTTIGKGAFSDCRGLTSVNIPCSVTTIGEWAFSGCCGLTSVNIPGIVTTIGEWAFSGCSGLTSVNIPGSVTTIGERAFSGSSLEFININNLTIKLRDKGSFRDLSSDRYTLDNMEFNKTIMSKQYEKRKFIIIEKDFYLDNQDVLALNSSNMPNGIKFTNKYFIKNVLYICHPYKTDTYLPFDNYEYELFKEEMAELQLFLNYLGAKRVEITNREQTTNSRVDKDTSDFNVEGNYKVAKGSFSIESRSEEVEMEKTFSNLIINQSFRQPTKRFPRPKNIPWIDNNEQYLRIEEQVLTYGNLYNHKIVVDTESVHFARSEEKTSINAALKVIMSKAKGSYNESTDSIKMKHVRKTWTLSVDFFPPAETHFENKDNLQND